MVESHLAIGANIRFYLKTKTVGEASREVPRNGLNILQYPPGRLTTRGKSRFVTISCISLSSVTTEIYMYMYLLIL